MAVWHTNKQTSTILQCISLIAPTGALYVVKSHYLFAEILCKKHYYRITQIGSSLHILRNSTHTQSTQATDAIRADPLP